MEKPSKNPNNLIMEITTSLIKDGSWALSLSGNDSAIIRKKHNSISEQLTKNIEEYRLISKGNNSTKEISGKIENIYRDWEEFKGKYDSKGKLKPLN